jgi:lipoate-protein ligase A
VIERTTGDVAEFLEQSTVVGPDPAVLVFTPPRATLVLGSRQTEEVVDLDAAQARNIDVARRRTGGGAVLVDPDTSLWIDVALPCSHPLWVDDVRASPQWLGDCWNAALQGLGIAGQVHRGGLELTPWGSLVCFAGIGPGEVSVGKAKVVGISQRRTRDGARFQCLVYAGWDAGALVDLLRLPPDA